jgi:hypothetical protein
MLPVTLTGLMAAGLGRVSTRTLLSAAGCQRDKDDLDEPVVGVRVGELSGSREGWRPSVGEPDEAVQGQLGVQIEEAARGSRDHE